ncbi:MAG TPA: phosphatase PAP2 family protein [Thermoleophilaceae bacterium]|jgi:undecaprenyl-diphosphatase
MLGKLRNIPAVAWPAALVALVVLLGLAVEAGADIVSFDHAANQTVHDHAREPVTGWAFVITALGSTYVLIGVALAAALGLALRGRWRSGLTLIVAYMVTDLTVAVVKLIVERPRPDANLTEAGGFSFPSGHSAMSMAVYGCLAFALARACRGFPRVACALGGAAIVVAIGLSRIYLGVHYPSDVFAGWITGATIFVGTWLIAPRVVRLREPTAA